jgi:hypothetical protein
VRVSWNGRRGDRYEYSSFLRGLRNAPQVSRAKVTDGVQDVTASPRPGAVSTDSRRYYSASDPRLRRVRMRWRLRSKRSVSVTTCRAQ